MKILQRSRMRYIMRESALPNQGETPMNEVNKKLLENYLTNQIVGTYLACLVEALAKLFGKIPAERTKEVFLSLLESEVQSAAPPPGFPLPVFRQGLRDAHSLFEGGLLMTEKWPTSDSS